MDIPPGHNQTFRASDSDRTIFLERPPLEVPLNLTTWVAPEKIVDWIGEAVSKLDPTRAEVQAFSQLGPEQRPRVLLTVLLFAYATEKFGSSEIFGACHSDPVLRQICEAKPPFPNELEHFRRKNRLLLESLLGDIIKRAVREKYLPASQLPPGLQDSLQKRAVDQINTARHLSTLDGQ